jgi:hypothetical protein
MNSSDAPRATSKVPLLAVLHSLAHDAHRERVSVGDLLAAMEGRALGALLFLFAFPNVLPTPPGTSTILGAPLVFLAAQLAMGMSPWLPAVIASRSMTRADFASLVRRIGPWLARIDGLLRPRFTLLALPPMEYLVGLVCLLLALVLVLPIPLGNVLPALAISLLALGILESDGLWIIVGLAAAAVAAVVVSGVVFAIVKAALFLFAKGLS